MGTRGAIDLLFVTISHNVSFTGKVWWMLMLVLRVVVVVLAGFSLFSDEEDRFVCNTIQPGCSNLCFDVFSPVSVLRLWLFQLILLCLPHVLFATYVAHRLWTCPYSHYTRSPGGCWENSRMPPRFHCAYFLAVVLRMLLEAVFGAGQFWLFGLSVPKSFLCFQAPCTSGVECYVSRPTEKSLMLNLMLALASLSVLLSFIDLLSSAKAALRWRREVLMDEMSKGEQSSVFTSTTVSEDRDEKHLELLSTKANGGPARKPSPSVNERTEDGVSPAPTHLVLHAHLRPPLSPRPPVNPRMTTPASFTSFGPSAPVETSSGQQWDSSECQDKRAWV